MSEKKLFEELMRAIQSNDPQHLDFMMKNKSPYAVRDELENSLGKHVRDNYDLPDDRLNELFEHKFDTPNIRQADMKDWGEYEYSDPKNPKILIRKGLSEPEAMGTKLHELGHHKDIITGYEPSDSMKKLSSSTGTGLEAAENLFEGHHKKGLFGLESLREMAKSGKIKSVAHMAAPMLKALSLGAAGMAAAGAGQKAYAGDFEGAGNDIKDFATDIVVPDAIYSEGLNNNEDAELEAMKKAQETPEEKRFKKIRALLENR